VKARVISDTESQIVDPSWTFGTLSDYIIERDGVRVKGEGICYLEMEDGEYIWLDETFDEWCENARRGEEGFTILVDA
jgi:hypothetical protein